MEMLQAPEHLGTQLLLEQLPLLQAALRMAMLLVRG